MLNQANDKKKTYKKPYKQGNSNNSNNQRAVQQAFNPVKFIVSEDKITKMNTKILKPKDMEEIVLQTNPNFKKLSLLQLAETTLNFGTNTFFDCAFQAQVKQDNIAACEIKRIPYAMEFPMPDDINFVGVGEGRRQQLLQTYQYQLTNHDKERIKLKMDRVKLITRLFQLLSTDLREQVEPMFPQYMTNPDVIAVVERIEVVYDLAYFDGRKDDLDQQVTYELSEFYNGQIALNSFVKHGCFDIPKHKRIFEQLLTFRKVAGHPDMEDTEKAKYFIYSCGSIRYLKSTITDLKKNESLYQKLPKVTDEEIVRANLMREMPLTLQAAVDLIQAVIADDDIVYKSDLKAMYSKAIHSQKSTVEANSQSDNNQQNKKRKVESENNTTKVCHICLEKNKGSHTTMECTLLPHAILALKAQHAANNSSKKGSNNSTTTTATTNQTKTKKTKKHVQKVNVQVQDSDLSDEDAMDEGFLNYIKGYQKSNRYVPEVHRDRNNPCLTQFDNGCSTQVQEFRRIHDLTAYRRKEGTDYMIQTSNGLKLQKNAIVMEVKAFGTCLWNPNAAVNLVSQTWIEDRYKVDVIKDGNHTLSYHVHLDNYGIIVKFDKQPCGIFLGDLSPLLSMDWQEVPEFYQELYFEPPSSYNFQRSTISIDSDIDNEEFKDNDLEYFDLAAKGKIRSRITKNKSIKMNEKKLLEYALGVVQPNLGFIAPRSFEKLVNNNMIINCPLPANTIRRAVDTNGPTTVVIKAKTMATNKKSTISAYVNTLRNEERLIQMDFLFLQELVFFFAVAYPGFYSFISYVGYGEGARSAENVLPHMLHAFSTFKAMQKTIKFVSADGEGAFSKLVAEIQNNAGLYLPLSKGEHPVYLDIMTKKVKMIARATIIDAGYDPIRKLLIGVVKNAVYMCNRLPCSGNIDYASPMMFNLGVPLDFNNVANIRSLQLCEVKVEDTIKSNTMASRTVTCIALNPKVGANGWDCLNLLTNKIIKSQSIIPREPNHTIFNELSERREIERTELKRKPKSVIAATQAKHFDWRTNNFQCQKDKYGDLHTVIALKKELTGLIELKKSFHPVHLDDIPLEHRKRISGTQALFNLKTKDDTILDLKGRVVVKGNTQDRSQFDHVNEIKSPTVELSTIFQVLIEGAMRKYALVTIDFPQAFLNADQDKIQYTKFTKELAKFICVFWPEYKDFVCADGSIIVQLDKALYGQIQAPRLFNDLLVQLLRELGYKQNIIDLGLFSKELPELIKDNDDDDIGMGMHTISIVTHVDDLLAIVPVVYVNQYIQDMKKSFGDDITIRTNLSVSGKLVNNIEVEYLGMVLSMDYNEPVAKVNPRKYYTKLLTEYAHIVCSKTKRTPSKGDFLEIDPDSLLLSGDVKKEFERIVYRLRWPTHMAPDTLFHAQWLVSRIHKGLTEQDKDKIIHFLRYINGRKDLPMLLGPNREGKMRLSIFSDASQSVAPWTSTCASTGRGVFSVHSHKQKEVQIASAHTELVAASESVAIGRHIQHVMESRGVHESVWKPVDFYEDNMAVIHLMKNGRSINSKSKHIHIRYFFMKQYFDNGDFKMIHCPTAMMVADLNTKPLIGESFLYLRAVMLGYLYIYDYN